MPLVGGIYTAWAGEGVAGIVFRAVIAGICLLPPTMLMGATLPAISRWVKATPEGVAWLGFFYGGNIAGGVIGCLLAGFYLLRDVRRRDRDRGRRRAERRGGADRVRPRTAAPDYVAGRRRSTTRGASAPAALAPSTSRSRCRA